MVSPEFPWNFDFSPARLRLRLPLYRAVAAITRDERDLPRYPMQLPPHPVPTTPESPPAPVSVIAYRWRRPSPYVHRVGTLYLSIHEALWVPYWYGLRDCDPPFIKSFLDPLSPESRLSKPDLR